MRIRGSVQIYQYTQEFREVLMEIMGCSLSGQHLCLACIVLPKPDWSAPADVHMLLADLASEQESFEEALKDLHKALGLLQPVVKVGPAPLAWYLFRGRGQ